MSRKLADMRAFVRINAETGVVQVADVAVPEIGTREVLVAVHAFGVGIQDRYFIPPNGPFPYMIGTEGSGVVVRVGPDAERVDVGDRVLMTTAMQPKGGTWAEFVVVSESAVTPVPKAMGFPTAAGIPVAGKSAVESLHTLDLNAGDTLFVAGASGAIGTLVVQLAAARGIRVAGSASAGNREYLRSLDAEVAVDYRDPMWPDEVRRWQPGGVDAALAIQPGTAAHSLGVVRDGGHVVTVSGDAIEAQRGICVEQFVHREDAGAEMAQLIDDVAAGRIRVVLERIYPFAQPLSALEKTETRHARGKLVVSVR